MNSLNFYFKRVYVVTTLDDVERIEYIRSSCSSLEYELFTAPDTFYIKSDLTEPCFFPNENIPPQVFSLLMANQSILSNCLYNNISSVLILEDDIKFENNWESLFYEFMTSVPKDWGILNMGKHYSDKENRTRSVNDIYNIPLDIWNTVCVGINGLDVIKKTLGYIKESIYPLDAIYGKVYREAGISCYSPVKKMFSQLSYREKHIEEWGINKDDYKFISKIGR